MSILLCDQREEKIKWHVSNLTFLAGSVLSGGGSVPRPQATAEDWVNMINEFQKGSLSTRLGIPMIYGIDAVHGNNNVYKATIFPHNIGLGATRFVFIYCPSIIFTNIIISIVRAIIRLIFSQPLTCMNILLFEYICIHTIY